MRTEPRGSGSGPSQNWSNPDRPGLRSVYSVYCSPVHLSKRVRELNGRSYYRVGAWNGFGSQWYSLENLFETKMSRWDEQMLYLVLRTLWHQQWPPYGPKHLEYITETSPADKE